MDIVWLIVGVGAVAGLFGGLFWLLGRTGRNDDGTHGGGLPGDVTGGTGGP
jgi:hypothetical protein